MSKELTIVFSSNSTQVVEFAKAVVDFLTESNLAEKQYYLGEECIDIENLVEAVEGRGKPFFNFEGKSLKLDLTRVGAASADIFRLVTNKEISWESFVLALKNQGEFVQAFLVDTEYDFWQNAEDLLEYETRGKSHEHLPKKSNGLPFPLDDEIIDVSNNPGRWIFKDGYIESVSCPHWVSSKFWELVGTKAPTITLDSIKVSQIDGLEKIEYSKQPFTFDSDKEIQNSLREVIYGKAVLGR